MKKLLLAKIILAIFAIQSFGVSNQYIDTLLKQNNERKVMEYCHKKNCYACKKLLDRYLELSAIGYVSQGFMNFFSSSFLGFKVAEEEDNQAMKVAEEIYDYGCYKYKCQNVCNLK